MKKFFVDLPLFISFFADNRYRQNVVIVPSTNGVRYFGIKDDVLFVTPDQEYKFRAIPSGVTPTGGIMFSDSGKVFQRIIRSWKDIAGMALAGLIIGCLIDIVIYHLWAFILRWMLRPGWNFGRWWILKSHEPTLPGHVS